MMHILFKVSLTRASERMLLDKNYREAVSWLKSSYSKHEVEWQLDAVKYGSILKTLYQLGLIRVSEEDMPSDFAILIEFDLNRFEMGLDQ